ncbi:hypothetical protein BGZ49_001450 [Haplosporangium sp. Z 27]|nr:hypothetical protein BGZ49_001450 [Haplosporangium sp. Z 27]
MDLASSNSGASPPTLIGGNLLGSSCFQQASNTGNNIPDLSRSSSLHPSIDVSVCNHTPSANGEPARATVVKDITFWGGLCLLICNTTGPGAVSLPLIAQSSGWVPTVIGFVVIGFLSYLSSVFIGEAMTDVPGNEQFQENVEFSNLVFCFFGRKFQIIMQMICFLAMQTTNIASIAICAQVFDNLLIQLFHKTCGIQVHPTAAFICVTDQLPSSSPFSGTMIMSTGTVLALVMVLPLCLMNLSENIWIQVVSCIIILLVFLQWIVTIFKQGIVPSRVPAVGSDLSQIFGSILFNYGYVTAIPSLANAKTPKVSLQRAVGCNVSIMTTIYLIVTIFGAMAFEIPSNSSLIQAIASSPNASTLSKIAGFVFPIAALVTSIPVNTIVLRYNLIQSGTCNKTWANFMAGGLPWLFAIPGMTGSTLNDAVGWCSLLFVSAATFVIPYVLFISAKRFKEKLKRREMAESEREGEQTKESSITMVAETGLLDRMTGSKILGKLAFWRKDNSGLDKKDIDDKKNTDVGSPAKSENESERDAGSFMEEQECGGVTGVSEYDEKEGKDPISEKTVIHDHGSPQMLHEEASSSSHHRIRSQGNQAAETIVPPFLSGNNYTIPGLGMCQPRSRSLSRSSSEFALHLSMSEEDTQSPVVETSGGLDMDLENNSSESQHNLKPAMHAIPRWVPIPAVGIAWGSLALTLVGIIATIIVKFVQL